MTEADLYRKTLIENIIKDGTQKNNRLNVNFKHGKGVYSEVITLDEIKIVTNNFTTHNNVESFLNEFISERLTPIMGDFNINWNSDEYDKSCRTFEINGGNCNGICCNRSILYVFIG